MNIWHRLDIRSAPDFRLQIRSASLPWIWTLKTSAQPKDSHSGQSAPAQIFLQNQCKPRPRSLPHPDLPAGSPQLFQEIPPRR